MGFEDKRLVWVVNLYEIQDGLFATPDGPVRLINGVSGEPKGTEFYSSEQLSSDLQLRIGGRQLKGIYKVEGDEGFRMEPWVELSGDHSLDELERLFRLPNPQPAAD
jgi:hypothetical protein